MERNKKIGKVFLSLYVRKYRQQRVVTSIYTEVWNSGTLAGSGALLHFLDSLACLFFGGAHFKHIVSTEGDREREREDIRRHVGVLLRQEVKGLPVIGGFLYWALFRCSSTSLGVTQITC